MEKTNVKSASSLEELKLCAMSFDSANSVPVYATSAKLRQKQYQGIWNVEKNKLCAIAGKDYNIIQHRDFVGETASALQRLNLRSSAKVRDSGDKVIVDITFNDSKLFIQKGEEFYTGIRMINSYNKTTGVMILPHLVRLACTNGMVMNIGWVKSFNVRHNSKMSKDFESIAKKIIDDMVNGNDKFKALVESCLIDSVEWAILDKILPVLFQTEKHREAIQGILKQDGKDKVTRWDLYNAVTDYVSHSSSLSVGFDIALQNKAQQILVTPLANLPKVEVEAEATTEEVV